jgi:ankyrin repeat protein
MLLRFGANTNICDDRGTPLLAEAITLTQSYWCCWTWQCLSRDKQVQRSQERSAEFIKAVVQNDPSVIVNIRECMGYNPLHTSAVCRNLVAVEVLLKGEGGPRPGCAARVLAIIATDKNGYTPINHATMRGQFKQTEFMYLWIIQHNECIRNSVVPSSHTKSKG